MLLSSYSGRICFVAIGAVVISSIGGCYRPATTEAPASKPQPAATGAIAFTPDTLPTATPTAGPSPTATAAATPDPSATAPRPTATSTASARVPPGRALPSTVAQAVSSRSPRSPTPTGSRPTRTRVLSAPKAAGGVIGISFDDVMFEMQPGEAFAPSMFTDAIRGLFDKKVKIRGYILPQSCLYETGVTQFILVRDNQECCFGPGAALYDCIVVEMVPGRTTNFSVKPVAVEGKLTFREYKDLDGKHQAIYHLDAEKVE